MQKVDPLFLGLLRVRQRRFKECEECCNQILSKQQLDQAAWLVKARALAQDAAGDENDTDDAGVGDLLLDENSVAAVPRPGTSIARGGTASSSVRPVTQSGRPITGFARPGTGAAAGAGGGSSSAVSFSGPRPGTSARPLTGSTRSLRLGTASMSGSDQAGRLDTSRMDLRRWGERPGLSRVLFEYIVAVEGNVKRALELASIATEKAGFGDWWWKARIGRCYYALGMLRDAEKQLKSSLADELMVSTVLELVKVYLRMDQPNTAMAAIQMAVERFPAPDGALLLSMARIHEMVGSSDLALAAFQRVLDLNPSSVEAIASVASHYFYTDQPEHALRLYRRLLQLGIATTECWNNIALCCFYSGQLDLTLTCFERALAIATDVEAADVWYNIGHVAIASGDLAMAHQAFTMAVTLNSFHAEAFNNLGVLHHRKGALESAKASYDTAAEISPALYEPFFNGALSSHATGDVQATLRQLEKSLKAYPNHNESRDLQKKIMDGLAGCN